MKLANPVGLRTGILRRGIYPVGSEDFARPEVVGGGGLCQDGGLVREIWELKASEGVEVEAEGKERRIFF